MMGVTDKRTSPSLPVFHNITWVLKFIIIWEASIFELTPSPSLTGDGCRIWGEFKYHPISIHRKILTIILANCNDHFQYTKMKFNEIRI